MKIKEVKVNNWIKKHKWFFIKFKDSIESTYYVLYLFDILDFLKKYKLEFQPYNIDLDKEENILKIELPYIYYFTIIPLEQMKKENLKKAIKIYYKNKKDSKFITYDLNSEQIYIKNKPLENLTKEELIGLILNIHHFDGGFIFTI